MHQEIIEYVYQQAERLTRAGEVPGTSWDVIAAQLTSTRAKAAEESASEKEIVIAIQPGGVIEVLNLKEDRLLY